ncbi:hypothetical protein C2G38_256972 [Gigaspora rosea]|uniref:TLDc domain-containing protein n=1 Tax=Gigaspora rosea TaxID=44941 RepID=A0A397VX12_9GLOM|nr:hypothetical protein C2G38_256972 [Gigaspora rosea]
MEMIIMLLLRYIYGGVFSLENLDASSTFDIMLVACDLLLEELVKHLETHLIEVEAHWLRSHFAYVYKTSFKINKLQELQKWCNNIAIKYPNIIFDSEDFTSLQENALISLIKRDDLQLKEVEVWNYVIKWGVAKNPGLPSNPENWSQENFQNVKTTLKNCLPHIRYFQIPGEDVVDSVRPYKKLLEKNLWKDLSNKFMAPNKQISSTVLPPRIILKSTLPTRTIEPFSTVITEEHKAEIATWIDKKTETYDIANIPYEFKLLLRGTRDGFSSDSFWKLCDKQLNTVTVMKVKDTDEILGGYNPLAWDKSKYYTYTRCENSFIFSLKNGTIKLSILSRVQNPAQAIYSRDDSGVNFDDLIIFNDKDECTYGKNSYEKQIRDVEGRFSINEYEIFQIHDK